MPITELVDILGSLTVGTAALLAIGAAGWVFGARRVSFAGAIQLSAVRPHDGLGLAILFLSAFGVGTLFQALADDVTDSRPKVVVGWLADVLATSPEEDRAWSRHVRLPNEESTRFWAIYRRASADEAPPSEPWRIALHDRALAPSSLGGELLRSRSACAFYSGHGHTDALYMLHGHGRDDADATRWFGDAKRLVMLWYYRSHNWCYLQPTLMPELDTVQRNLELGRGLYLVAVFGTLLLLTAGLGALAFRLCCRLRSGWGAAHLVDIEEGRWRAALRDRIGWERPSETRELIGSWARCFRTVVSLLVAVSLLLFGQWAYRASSQSYNERVFGYFLTHEREGPLGAPGCSHALCSSLGPAPPKPAQPSVRPTAPGDAR